jgi:pimeloyl-ACP methyl ester carboxylesterase
MRDAGGAVKGSERTSLSSRLVTADVVQHTEEVDGVPVSWSESESEGESTRTLYVHGVPNSSAMWREFLQRTGGLAIDLPGFGASVKAGTFPFSIASYDGFLERFLDARSLERIQLVVHDWGAAALALAQRAPERIERLVVINALPLFDGHQWPRAARIFRTPVLGELAMGSITPRLLRRTLRGANANPLPDAFLREMYAGIDFGTQRAILKLHRSVGRDTLAAAGAGLSAIDAPALVLWGALDPFIPSRFAARYADALGGETELVLLEDAGHWPWLDDPEALELVVRFLAPT